MEASLLALEQTDQPTKVEQTLGDIKDKDIYERKTVTTLLKMAPAEFNEGSFSIEPFRLANEKIEAKVDRVLAKRKKLKSQQKQVEAEKWRNDFLDKCQNLHDGTYWHSVRNFVVGLTPDGTDFVILGKREKIGDKTVVLTKADLATIEKMGLTSNLAEQYKQL
jgi:hypothetical protein